jgi:hypothetical protein
MPDPRTLVSRAKLAVRRRLVKLIADGTKRDEQLDRLGQVTTELSAAQGQIDRMSVELAAVREQLAEVDRHACEDRELDLSLTRIVSALLDDVPALRRQLEELRRRPEYETYWSEPEPLVTVRIATYNLAPMLMARALASVRRQTYPRFEVVVVGDACTDDTEARIRSLHDDRIRFVNLPLRGDYPEGRFRQMVAGAPCMNLGAQLARGTWLAPLDDDDEFEPDHLEVLVRAALDGSYELAYGNFRMIRPDSAVPEVYGRWPPTYGEFGYQAAVYLTALRFFEYDNRSWLLDEPADMTLRRRMVDAGVRMGWLDRVVSTYYPSLLHRPVRA